MFYHTGLLSQNIRTLHVGTLSAAKSASPKRTHELFTVSFPAGKSIIIQDTGVNHTPKDIMKALNAPDWATQQAGDSTLWTYLKMIDIDYIQYINTREDAGSISYIVDKTKCEISIVHV